MSFLFLKLWEKIYINIHELEIQYQLSTELSILGRLAEVVMGTMRQRVAGWNPWVEEY